MFGKLIFSFITEIIFRLRLDLAEVIRFYSLQNFEICLSKKLRLIEYAQKWLRTGFLFSFSSYSSTIEEYKATFNFKATCIHLITARWNLVCFFFLSFTIDFAYGNSPNGYGPDPEIDSPDFKQTYIRLTTVRLAMFFLVLPHIGVFIFLKFE